MKANKCKYCSVPEIDIGQPMINPTEDNHLSLLLDTEDFCEH